MGQEVWLLLWYCVTTTNSGCMKWDGTTEKSVTSFNSEAECVSYAEKFARKVHSSLHFDLEYFAERAFRLSHITPIAIRPFKLIHN